MILKTQIEINKYKDAAKLSTSILRKLKDATKEGVYPIEIENLAKKLCRQNKVKPAFLGVGQKEHEYQFATCISINDTVVHGIPSSKEIIKKGDIVKVDFGIIYQGLYTDHCYSLGISPISPDDEKLLKVGRHAIWQASQFAVAGNRVGDISSQIQQIAEKNNLNVVRRFTGHGIGKTLHESPQIPAFGKKGEGKLLKNGEILCIEAQIVPGSPDVKFMSDGWTVKMIDGKKAVMFEWMVIVQKNKPLILTAETYNWEIIT